MVCPYLFLVPDCDLGGVNGGLSSGPRVYRTMQRFLNIKMTHLDL